MVTLIALKGTRSAEKIICLLSTGLALPLPVEDIARLGLTKGRKLDDQELGRLIQSSVAFLLYSYSLRQIALSPKTELILQRKLSLYYRLMVKKYPFPPTLVSNSSEIITQVLGRLADRQLLAPQAYLQYFVHKHHAKSHQYLKYHLLRAGVPSSLVSKYFHSLSDVSQRQTILTYLTRRYQPSQLRDYKVKNKVLSALIRRGFEYSDIEGAFDEFLINQ
jgi:SOS response regulatory protein OraA/RecX